VEHNCDAVFWWPATFLMRKPYLDRCIRRTFNGDLGFKGLGMLPGNTTQRLARKRVDPADPESTRCKPTCTCTTSGVYRVYAQQENAVLAGL